MQTDKGKRKRHTPSMAGGTEVKIVGAGEGVEKERNCFSWNSQGGPAAVYSTVSVQETGRCFEYFLPQIHLRLRRTFPLLPSLKQARTDWFSTARINFEGVEEPPTEDPGRAEQNVSILGNCHSEDIYVFMGWILEVVRPIWAHYHL